MTPSTLRSRIKPWMLVSAVWIWPAVMNVVSRVAHVKLDGWDAPNARELLFVAGDWLIYAVVTPFIFWISRRWPVVKPHVARRVRIHVAFALLFCVVWAVSGKIFDLVLVSLIDPDRLMAGISAAGNTLGATVTKNVAGWILTTLPFGVVVYTTVAAMAHAVDYFTEAREREVQNAKLAEQLTGARFAALQAQLNPHFLFNTLNTIAVLVRDGDRAGAVRIVEQLSDVLRRTLSRHRANEVMLEEELDLVRQYLAIEQARFSDRLRVTIDADASLAAAAVPGFAVQHLVENAIRHGIARRAEAGVLRVAVRRDGDALEITVTDDGPGLNGGVATTGHGLDNTRERLRALYGDRASLVVADVAGGGVVATLRVPYRELAPHAAGVADRAEPADPAMPRAEWGVMIADDEPAARRGVRQLLASFPDFRVVAECRNGAEVLARLDESHAQVLFLDVQMPGMDGFEVIRRRTPERMPAVVFLTAYDEFALKAFDAQALDYLVKPVTEARFAATMRRLARQLRGSATAREPSVVVTTSRGTMVIELREIDWIESADNYSRLWVGARNYLLRESLNSLERRVRAHGFARVHRQALIRVGAVRELARAPKDGLVAVLGSGARVPVSRRRRAAVGKVVRAT